MLQLWRPPLCCPLLLLPALLPPPCRLPPLLLLSLPWLLVSLLLLSSLCLSCSFSPSLPLPVLLSSDRGVALPSWPSFLLPIGSLPLAPLAATPIGVGYPYQSVGFSLLSLSFSTIPQWNRCSPSYTKVYSFTPLSLYTSGSTILVASSVTCNPLTVSCALTVFLALRAAPLCYLSRKPSWPVGGARFMDG